MTVIYTARTSVGCKVLQLGLRARAQEGIKLVLLGALGLASPLALGKFGTQHDWTDIFPVHHQAIPALLFQASIVIRCVVPVRSQPSLYTRNPQLLPSDTHLR